MSYEVLETKQTYKGKIISVREDVLQMPDGKPAIREVVERKDAAAILPIDAEGNLILVRQYRHPFQEMLLEVPAGVMEKGEEPKDCIIRELSEETGYHAKEVEFICELYPTVGFCTERIYLYLAQVSGGGEQHLDADEFIEIEKYTLAEALEMISDGRIRDAKTIVLILAYQNRHK